MKSQGYAASNEEHTRIPGIWKKLGTLYNLQPLDERVRGHLLGLVQVLVANILTRNHT